MASRSRDTKRARGTNILLIYLFYCFISAASSADARKLEHHFSRRITGYSSKKDVALNLVKHLDASTSPVPGEVDDIIEHDHDGDLRSSATNNYIEPFEVSSPFSVPSFDSLDPVALTENVDNTPPFCAYPPSNPNSPSSYVPSIPPPSIPAGQGGSDGSGGGGYGGSNGYTPQPFPSSPFGSITNPTPPPPPPLPSSSNYEPYPPMIGPPASVYSYTPPPPSSGNYEPIPPIVAPPTSGSNYIPPPPSSSSYESSPPIVGPPGSASGYLPPPSAVPSYGFVPSPPVFQPPVVFPPPRVPPQSPNNGPNTGALWCVAKPSVPDPIIEEAMNYACGSGADCESLQPNQPCFQPNTLFAHASYAFNSYWQRTKAAGGTCEFGGTAILVTVDPSYNGCQFLSNGS